MWLSRASLSIIPWYPSEVSCHSLCPPPWPHSPAQSGGSSTGSQHQKAAVKLHQPEVCAEPTGGRMRRMPANIGPRAMVRVSVPRTFHTHYEYVTNLPWELPMFIFSTLLWWLLLPMDIDLQSIIICAVTLTGKISPAGLVCYLTVPASVL